MFNCSGGLPISVFLKMLFNTGQYRVTVGIFNNQKLIINLRFELSSCYLSLRNITWFYCSLDDDNLVISGYNLVCSGRPSNIKCGGVCLYYTNYLPLRLLNISYLKECLNIELMIGDKSCNSVVLNKPPCQSQ